MLVFKLFDMWGEAGWLEHTNKVALFYQQRRDAFMHYAAKHLTGKATWVNPSSGLFVWFDLSPSGVSDSQALIQEKAMEAKVILVPGTAFNPVRPSSLRRLPHRSLSYFICSAPRLRIP